MSSVRSSSKSALFLIEFIIAVAFFAVTSAVCMQLFVKAHIISNKSDDLSMGMNAAQSAAEFFKATNATPTEMANLLHATSGDGGRLYVYYDSNWQAVNSPDNAYYVMQVDISISENSVATAKIEVDKSLPYKEHVFSLEAKKYLAKGGSNE